MFRKPLRLEKWIAFDGALVADVVDAGGDSDASENTWQPVDDFSESSGGNHDVAGSGMDWSSEFSAVLFDLPVFSPLSLGSNTIGIDADPDTPGYELSLEFPKGFDVSTSDPFRPYGPSGEVVDLNIDPSFDDFRADHLFFELGKPENGSFGFLRLEGSNAFDIYGFIDRHDLVHNQWYIIEHVSGGNRSYVAVKAFNFGLLKFFSESESALKVEATSDGALRFGFLINGKGGFDGEQLVETLFKSLTFTAKDAGQTHSGAFSLTAWYQQHSGLGKNPGLFGDGEGGVFNSSNTPIFSVKDVTQNYVPGGENDGVANPSAPSIPSTPSEPEPEPELPPLPPPVEGGDDSDFTDDEVGIDPAPPVPPSEPEIELVVPPPIIDAIPGGDSGADAYESGNDADMSSEASDGANGADANDGAVSGQDDLVYIFRREDDGSGDNAGVLAGISKEVDDETEDVLYVDDRLIESAAEAAMLELVRDFETALTAVRGDMDALSQALVLLREEYLSRESGDWIAVRAVLQEMFESGRQELAAVNRVIDQMNRLGEVFKNLPAERRDGMLKESLRELIDSAHRHSGKAGALSEALVAVGKLFRESRLEGGVAPSEVVVREMFAQTHENALDGWAAKAERIDPMGRELSERGLKLAAGGR